MSDTAFPSHALWRSSVCHCPSHVSLSATESPLRVGGAARRRTAIRATGVALPQGPSLRPGLCCPGPSSLTRSHPPHSPAHRDFTARQLIPNVFARLSRPAARDWFRAFTACSFLTCRPLRPRGSRLPSMPRAMADDTGLRRFRTGSALPRLPPSVSGGPLISGLHWFAHSLRPARWLASLTDPTGLLQPQRLLLSGFQRVGHPSRCRV